MKQGVIKDKGKIKEERDTIGYNKTQCKNVKLQFPGILEEEVS